MDLESPQTRYAMLRTSLEMFQQPPADLDDENTRALQQRVNSELAIGRRLLKEQASSQVVVPDASVEDALSSLASGFESEEDFIKTLSYNGLDVDSLRSALRYELSVEAALEQLVNEEAMVSEHEAEIYYLQHQDRFTLPETRTVSHILITINDDYEENTRDKAMARIEELRAQCGNDGKQLKQLAERHSECPSAMKEGVIGRVKPGQLYPQLDEVLFKMPQGALSDVVESEVGLHILYCEQIHSSEILSFEGVKEKLVGMLENKKRSTVLKQHLMR